MKEILLTQGFVALVDDEDYGRVMAAGTWNKSPNGYARYSYWYDGKSYSVTMHRFVLGLVRGDGKVVDHINNNRLDNQKINLRICTSKDNIRNALPAKGRRFKGVFKVGEKWDSRIRLGIFDTEIEAAKAYNEAAQRQFGEFAYLNNVN